MIRPRIPIPAPALLLAALLLLAPALAPPAGAHLRNPAPEGTAFHDVMYAAGQFVAVGQGGTILSSADGLAWTTRSSGTTRVLRGVAYSPGDPAAIPPVPSFYVVVGDNGFLATSPDGAAWTSRSIGEPTQLFAVSARDNGKVVACGEGGAIYSSQDGMDWVRNLTRTSATFRDIWAEHYNGVGWFITVGDNGWVHISAYQNQWSSARADYPNNLYGIASDNNVFIVVGSSGRPWRNSSMSLTAWEPCSLGISKALNDITAGNGRFVAVGDEAAILTSDDGGANWTDRSLGIFASLARVAYGNGRFVAVGSGGTIVTSVDGVSWQGGGVGFSETFRAVLSAGGRFVAVGDNGAFFHSGDGAAWSLTRTGVDRFASLAWGNGNYVAVGDSGATATSVDGIAWTVRQPVTGRPNLRGVAFDNDAFVFVTAGDGGALFKSSQGSAWQPLAPGTGSRLNGIAYGDAASGFIAVGDNGTVLGGRDAGQWSVRDGRTTGALLAVAHADNVFVAVGRGGEIVTSPDGITWANRSSAVTRAAGDLHGVAWGAGHFLATGDNGAVLDSSDGGATWLRKDAGTTRTLRAVAFGDNTFVLVGDFGVIAQSDPVIVTVTTTSSSPAGGGCAAAPARPSDGMPGFAWFVIALLGAAAPGLARLGARRHARRTAGGRPPHPAQAGAAR